MHSTETNETSLTIIERTPPVVARQAETDSQLIDLWLHGKSRHTQRAYRSAADRLFGFVSKPIHQIMLGDLQAFANYLEQSNLMASSRNRTLAAVKSLFAFGHRLGYLPFDVGRILQLPGHRDGLADRILDESEIFRIVQIEPNPRNHALLALLYGAGLRVSEVCGLTWRDVQAREDGGQLTVFGKGNKTRVVLLASSVFGTIASLRDGDENSPVFRSRKGGHLDPSQVLRIVKASARRAGIAKPVSPHFFRHSHASHALDHGAPIHLVQTTLGHASVATTGRYLHARPSDSSGRYLRL